MKRKRITRLTRTDDDAMIQQERELKSELQNHGSRIAHRITSSEKAMWLFIESVHQNFCDASCNSFHQKIYDVRAHAFHEAKKEVGRAQRERKLESFTLTH